jgi:hypothetical protein
MADPLHVVVWSARRMQPPWSCFSSRCGLLRSSRDMEVASYLGAVMPVMEMDGSKGRQLVAVCAVKSSRRLYTASSMMAVHPSFWRLRHVHRLLIWRVAFMQPAV